MAFPLFLILSTLVYRTYKTEPRKKELWVRKWLLVLTLFIAGGALAGDLITLIYYFVDGKELTTGFILKALAVFVVAVGVFWYFLEDIRDRITSKTRKIWFVVSVILVLASIVLAFSVIGSPRTQRLVRYDQEKVRHLQTIQSHIVNFWQRKNRLPNNLDELKNPISSIAIPVDPQSGNSYEYEVIGDFSFQICADFNRESGKYPTEQAYYSRTKVTEDWKHDEGVVCFEREIDPDLYNNKPVPVYYD